MKVQIRDHEALESLTAAGLREYLEANGWSYAGHWGERPIVIYSKEQDARKWEILVPLRDTASDYAEMLGLAVTTLAEAEDRSQLDVFGDLTNWSIDRAPPTNHGETKKAPNIWRVGAEKGKYTEHFVAGGYAAAGWIRGVDLTEVKEKEEFKRLFRKENSSATPAQVNGNAAQIRRFIVEIKPGDYIITPTTTYNLLRYGRVKSGVYYKAEPDDGCPFPHRRQVDWAKRPLNSQEFPQKLYNAMKFPQLTVYSVRHREQFLAAVVESLWLNARWL